MPSSGACPPNVSGKLGSVDGAPDPEVWFLARSDPDMVLTSFGLLPDTFGAGAAFGRGGLRPIIFWLLSFGF